jgi:hypothetical protein
VQGGIKVCRDRDEGRTRKTVHRLWPNEALPGELAQVLPTPERFEQASQLGNRGQVANEVRSCRALCCGPD